MSVFLKHRLPHDLQGGALLTILFTSSALGVIGFLVVVASLLLWIVRG